MFSFLFPRLTPSRGEALFDAVTAEARTPHWYVDGQVPDTIDGRFRVLATLAALVAVRLESAGVEGEAASVAMTERFIAVMETEHREIGLGDPTLGRTVRKLVGSLAGRVELWRAAIAGADPWDAAVAQSFQLSDCDASGIAHNARALKDFWSRLERNDVEAISAGRIG